MATEPPEYHSITIGATSLPIAATVFNSTPTAGDLIIEAAPPTAATTTTTAAAFPTQANTLARKRQRRPSVRLGEIGDQPAASLSVDTHVRTKNPPASSWHQNQSWATKEQSKSVRNRSLTNLVNGSDYYEEEDNNSNQIQNYPQQSRKALKSKRVSATTAAKRVRLNWVTRPDSEAAAAKSESREEDEGFRDFDQDSDQSPVHSADMELELRHNRHHRINDNIYGSEMDNDSKCEGVRTWLIELGLSRYAPVFEIHEVDDEVLPMLTLEDLKDMGINAVGSRRKLYAAIQKLRHKGFS